MSCWSGTACPWMLPQEPLPSAEAGSGGTAAAPDEAAAALVTEPSMPKQPTAPRDHTTKHHNGPMLHTLLSTAPVSAKP